MAGVYGFTIFQLNIDLAPDDKYLRTSEKLNRQQ